MLNPILAALDAVEEKEEAKKAAELKIVVDATIAALTQLAGTTYPNSTVHHTFVNLREVAPSLEDHVSVNKLIRMISKVLGQSVSHSFFQSTEKGLLLGLTVEREVLRNADYSILGF